MISVLVITYNQSKYIGKCLDSILSQVSNEPFEILVGDDCSTDGTDSIVVKYAIKYPNIVNPIIRRRNIGATANLFDLIRRANGRYMCFCEGDDYWTANNKLSLQTLFLDNYSEYASIVHRVTVVNEDGRECISQNISWIKYKNIYNLKDFDGLHLPAHLSSLFVKNSYIFKDTTIEGMLCDKNSSDKVVFLLALVIGKMALINNELSAYRFMRKLNSDNIIAKTYSSKISRSLSEMKIIVSMEKWLFFQLKLKKSFIQAQSKWLLTAIFHKIRGHDLSLFDVWNLCTHKLLCICYMPIAILFQIISRVREIFKIDIR